MQLSELITPFSILYHLPTTVVVNGSAAGVAGAILVAEKAKKYPIWTCIRRPLIKRAIQTIFS